MPAVSLTTFHHEKEEKVRNGNEENVPHTLSVQLKHLKVSAEGNKETFSVVLLYLSKFSKSPKTNEVC